ncbi:hypothetical protein [Cylindrospermopsis curvispora]|nr:hypothetical protein [Cylindrospermopsis curvispora]
MKTVKLLTFLTVNLLMGLPLNQVVVAQQGVIEIKQELSPDPLVISGNSRARVKKDCGLIPSQPNQIIVVKESIPYLRLTLEGEGKATLLVDGPGGRFCMLPDGNQPEMTGFWSPGEYKVYVGNLSPGSYVYKVHLSRFKNSPNSPP